MNHPKYTARDRLAAIHWATEDLLIQMKQEEMSDEGYAVYRRIAETRERVRRQTTVDTEGLNRDDY